MKIYYHLLMHFLLSLSAIIFVVLFMNELSTNGCNKADIFMLSLSIASLALSVYHKHKYCDEETKLKNKKPLIK